MPQANPKNTTALAVQDNHHACQTPPGAAVGPLKLERALGSDDTFAVLVIGKSMAPRYKIGEFAIINGSLPVVSGSYVLVSWKSDASVHIPDTILHLVEQNADKLVFEHLSPPEQFTVDPAEVSGMLRVIGHWEQ
jgi:phage repressor protein C with HTH and peptisase S24 domain